MMLFRLLGGSLIASSFYFLWIFVPMIALAPYGLFVGYTAVDFTEDGLKSIVYWRLLPGMALLSGRIFVLKKGVGGIPHRDNPNSCPCRHQTACPTSC